MTRLLGCKDSSIMDVPAIFACKYEDSSGVSSTVGGGGKVVSVSSKLGSPGSSTSGAGRFGSSPALSAFAILLAWYFANTIFFEFSAFIGPNIFWSSKNVAAARNVSAVCLFLSARYSRI